jgi:hypothetical protein
LYGFKFAPAHEGLVKKNINMKLIDCIRTGRARQRGKKPLPETVWAVVAAIVQKFGLTAVPGEGVGGEPPETKPDDRLSLFPLLQAEQWRLTKEIIAGFANPYLVYARSPADFGLSRRLYANNPGLEAETLREQAMGWLWEKEAKRDLGDK